MVKDTIEEFITKFPIYQYAFIDTGDLEFSERVRTICKKECPRYGCSWSCPPAVGSIEKCRQKCLAYDQALFFSSVAEVEDLMNMEETLKTKNEHERITETIERYLKEQSLLVYTLSSESCSICEKCTYPRGNCRFPERMHPCIESHGILVPNLIEKNTMDYYLGDRLVLWFSMIFFREAKDTKMSEPE